jgi:DNA-binding MarR family transcriptional regulator
VPIAITTDPLPARHRLSQPQSLQDILLFRLSHYQALAGAPMVKICEGQFGISRREWRLLATLAESGAMNSSALALCCSLDRARTSRAISGLELKKLVHRHSGPSDQRQVRVELSEAGRALHNKLWPLVKTHQNALLAAFTAAEVAQLDGLLARLQTQAKAAAHHFGELPKANRRAGRRMPLDAL